MSNQFTLNGQDVPKILKGAAINFGGAVLFILGSALMDGQFEWPKVQAGIFVALGATLVNIARVFLSGPVVPQIPSEPPYGGTEA